MSTVETYTPNVALVIPGANDTNFVTAFTTDLNLLDGISAVGMFGVCPTEQPSTTLNVRVGSGIFRKNDGTIVTYAGTSSFALTGSATNNLYLTNTGTLTNVTGSNTWPAATDIVRIATIVTGVGSVTSITDARLPFIAFGANVAALPLAGGTLADGASISLGTSTGTQIGTATNQKLAFWGSTPLAQQASTVDIRTALINIGIFASGGANPLSLNGGALTCGAANINGTITIADATNVVLNSTTGTKIGTSASQKLSFFNASPVIQPAGAFQAAITDNSGGTASSTLAVITAGVSYSQTDMQNVQNAIASLAAAVNAHRTALTSLGLEKGSA